MTIYNYTDSGEYVTTTQARPNPLEPGKFLIPRNATTIAPPTAGLNEIAVFDGASWSISEDWRGTKYWTENDYDSVEAPYEVEKLGPLPVGALLTQPPVPVEIQSARDAAEAILDARKTWETVTDFYAEFTTAEKYGIQSSTDPAVVVARGDLAMWRGSILSDDPDRPEGTDNRIIAGLDALVAAGIIDANRKSEIIT